MTGRFRSLSIGFKTLISHIALALSVAIMVCVVSYMLCFKYLQSYLVNELSSQAAFIASETDVSDSGFAAPKRSVMKVYQQLTNAAVLYVDENYQAYQFPFMDRDAREPEAGESEISRIQIAENPDQEFVSKVLAGETVTAVRKFKFAEGMVMFVGCPILDGEDRVVGGVILAQPISELQELSNLMRALMIFSAVVSVLLAAILALTLSRRLTKPIQVITQGARRMADGEYGARVDVRTENEIGELGSVLNTLSNRVLQSTERLSEERDKLELIISSIGEGILAVDPALHLIHVNPAFCSLMEAESAQAALTGDGEDAQSLRALIRRVIDSGSRCEGHMLNRSGRNLAAIVSPFFGENGESVGAVCLIRDVSEAERLEQLRRDYVANISHELRTPLTGIRGMVEPLLDGYMDTEKEKQDCYRVIYQETIRLEKLVGEMLDMSRLQDGRVSLELEALEPAGILASAQRRMQGAADKCGIALCVEAPQKSLSCVGNEDRILQVLVIFLDNALSFTPEGGRVTVFAREMPDHVILGVRDTGVGIEPKDLPFIWERFYKADKSRLRTTGTGLGLAIAKLVVDLMGGETGVTSAVGKGSEFFFALPKEKR